MAWRIILRTMDRIAAMTAFVRVVEAGTFTRAADTLDLPNATVTRLIQGLEEELKVRLLHRTTRSVTVTPEGATYYERVVRLLADLSDIESSARQSLASPSGRVRVETAAALGTMVILPALGEFYRAYPKVEIELNAGNRYADLVAEGIDCAIRVGAVTEQFLVARRVGEFQFHTCATPALLASCGRPAAPEGLHEFPTVGLASARAGRSLPFRFLKDGQVQELVLQHRLVVNDTNSLAAAGTAGLGIVQAPTYAVHAALADRRLVAVLEEWHTNTIPVHVVYPPNRYLSAKVRVFIDWVIALFEHHEFLKRAHGRVSGP
ncbi:MAG: LysR family transcriptional regulator [Ramlibacter sp.]|nr:LysR family transcriptional regulator [Ramlibacter sp.]